MNLAIDSDHRAATYRSLRSRGATYRSLRSRGATYRSLRSRGARPSGTAPNRSMARRPPSHPGPFAIPFSRRRHRCAPVMEATMKKIHPKVAEAVDSLDLGTATRRRLLSGAGLVSASLAASALLTACSDDTPAAGAVGNFPKTPKWKFVFVCHVTTNPFFTPTQYGA